jgi:glycosyltransferase involved in cell wall biosynthesis
LMRLSVIVPFHRRLEQLSPCLVALRQAAARLDTDCEIIVAADGSPEDATAIAAASGARLLNLPGPLGPAAARNQAAAEASGDILVFVDSDVVAHSDALYRIERVFTETAGIEAVFGAYDDQPADGGFVSQSKNLAHAFVHSRSSREAVTFWAGLGAVRTAAFRRVGGFDERFVRVGANGCRTGTVEDIDLGYRLTAAGSRIALEPAIRGTHLKRWSATGALVSDVFDRGIPWTQLIHRYGQLRSDLNLTVRYRACVALAYVALAALLLTWVTSWTLVAAAGAICSVGVLDGPYLAFVARQRGRWFAARTLPLRLVHHLANGCSFVIGTMAHFAPRVLGVSFPGALPVDRWRTELARSA